jgi:hypothetical protein
VVHPEVVISSYQCWTGIQVNAWYQRTYPTGIILEY